MSKGLPIKIIQIAGKKHSGKSYLATKIFDYLSRKGYRIYKTAFAFYLKGILRECGVDKYKPLKIFYHFGVFYEALRKEIFRLFDELGDSDDLMGFFEKKGLLAKRVCDVDVLEKLQIGFELYFQKNEYEAGFRILAQTIGTDIFRQIDKNFWVKAIAKDIKKIGDTADFVIIDDYRFPNEDLSSYFGKDRVVRILLKTEKDESYDSHSSEISVDKVPYDLYVIRNRSEYNPSFDFIVQKIINNWR